jgi:Ca2+-binding EF-hand superfamily protein
LFAVFDKDKNGYLSFEEFSGGMITLFSEDYHSLLKFIFDMYDINRTGKIIKEDIRVVFSYINLAPKNNKKTSDSFGKMPIVDDDLNYLDRIESQNEIFLLLEKVFGNKNSLNYEEFVDIINNVSSEIFIYVKFF